MYGAEGFGAGQNGRHNGQDGTKQKPNCAQKPELCTGRKLADSAGRMAAILPHTLTEVAYLLRPGHIHAYERTFPVNNYQLDQCGPRYLTMGDGGNIEGLYKTFAGQAGTCTCTAVNNATFSNGCPCGVVAPSTAPSVRRRSAAHNSSPNTASRHLLRDMHAVLLLEVF